MDVEPDPVTHPVPEGGTEPGGLDRAAARGVDVPRDCTGDQGCAAGLMGLGLAFWYFWLIIIALISLLVTVGGLLFEYYVGQNATQS